MIDTYRLDWTVAGNVVLLEGGWACTGVGHGADVWVRAGANFVYTRDGDPHKQLLLNGQLHLIDNSTGYMYNAIIQFYFPPIYLWHTRTTKVAMQ